MTSNSREIVYYHPCSTLQPYVRFHYSMRRSGSHSALTFPTGCPQIIFHRKNPLFIPELNTTQSTFTISGQVNFPSHLTMIDELEMIVTVFFPHTIGMFIDTPPSEFYNTEISGYALANRSIDRLAARIFGCDTAEEAVTMIDAFLLDKLSRLTLPVHHNRIGTAIGLMFNRRSPSVSELSEAACLGKKQFERTFRNLVGMNPKEYARIVRFLKALAMMDRGSRDFPGIAFQAGYSDQAHFIREFRTFSGLTPRRLIVSDGFYAVFASPTP